MARELEEFDSVKEAMKDFRQGRMVIVVDDAERENEGDLIIGAEKCSPQAINFMAKHARGLICVPLTGERLDQLQLKPMVESNEEKFDCNFAVSVDAINTSTGISAFDRCQTVKALINPQTKASDLKKPGHLFPLRAKKGGVLERAGHSEAGVDLARLSGLYPGAVICEIMDESGLMARTQSLMKFKKKHDLKIIRIADLIEFRRRKEKLIERITEASFPTEFGEFKLIAFRSLVDNLIHLALVKGNIKGKKVLVRVHSQCLTGDTLYSLRCDCGKQLKRAMQLIAEERAGVILYMNQEGRGIGLENKLKAYSLQDQGLDTVQANLELGFKADLRDYGIGAQILVDLGLKSIKLLTNNPKKIIGLKGYGLEITERIPLEIKANGINQDYLKAKKEKLGHLLEREK